MSEILRQLLLSLQAIGGVGIAIGGLLLIVGARKLAVQVVIGAAGFIAVAALLPGALTLLGDLSALDIVTAVLAPLGVAVLLARRVGLGLSLIWPAISRWLVWPFVRSSLDGLPLGLEILILGPLAAFAAIRLLQKILTVVYGAPVADHVAGTYLVRLLDMFGRVIGILFASPVRLAKRLLRR